MPTTIKGALWSVPAYPEGRQLAHITVFSNPLDKRWREPGGITLCEDFIVERRRSILCMGYTMQISTREREKWTFEAAVANKKDLGG